MSIDSFKGLPTTSIDKKMPTVDAREAERVEKWKTLGEFVPEELRETADMVFSATNANLNFLEDLDDKKKDEFVRLLNEYKTVQDMPVVKTEQLKARIDASREIEKRVTKVLG